MIECTVKVYKTRTVWYLGDKLHRKDGPAIEHSNGDKLWYKNGILHREDGPACDYANSVKSYYLNGVFLTEEDFNKRKNSYAGKIVKIDEKKYKLSEVK